ncbi:MAG: HNH endonuclease [Alphaproteobacteria bacterium]|nr:HNH endonuclease [Alphaproteobacteria bacterium]
MSRAVSPINKMEKEEFQKLVYQFQSLADIIRYFNLLPGAGNYTTLKKRIVRDNIDISHIKLGIDSNRNRQMRKKVTSKEVLANGKFISGSTLKKVIFREGLLEEQCFKCGLGNLWQGEKINLTIDHIDGNRHNNLLENLRILCPNCHSQTPTFSGRNIKNKKTWKNNCQLCNKKLHNKKSIRCRRCTNLNNRTKITWPENNQLLELLRSTTMESLAKSLGVSSNAIRTRLKRRGLSFKRIHKD